MPEPVVHCYASVDQFKQYAVDDAASFGSASDANLLLILRSVSRTIDRYCRRSRGPIASGFGPRIGTNRYDGTAGQPPNAGSPWWWPALDLRDDLLSLTSVAVQPAVGADQVTYTDETDFYKQPYDGPPYRSLQLSALGQSSWYWTVRGISVAGTWGYRDTRLPVPTTVASGLASDAAATTFTTSAAPAISPGNTILVDDEQLFVSGLSGTSATVERGANGTTPATHADGTAIEVYTYPEDVTLCALVLAQKRRKMRDAGLVGDFGGFAGVPLTSNRDTERSVMREYLWPYAFAEIR